MARYPNEMWLFTKLFRCLPVYHHCNSALIKTSNCELRSNAILILVRPMAVQLGYPSVGNSTSCLELSKPFRKYLNRCPGSQQSYIRSQNSYETGQ